MRSSRTSLPGLAAVVCALVSSCGGNAPGEAASLGTEGAALSAVCPAIPAPGAPFTDSSTVALADPAEISCRAGTSNTAGYFLTSTGSATATFFRMYSPVGNPIEGIGIGSTDVTMLPMFTSFDVLYGFPSPPTQESLIGLPDSGGFGGQTTVQSGGINQRWHGSIDYGGGSLMAAGNTSLGGNHFFTITAQRFDSSANPRSAAVFVDTMPDAPAFLAGAVNLSGRSLVLWDGAVEGAGGDHVLARWLDRNGLPLSAVFDAGVAAGASTPGVQVETVPLFGNAIALRVNGVWAIQVRDGAVAGSAVPAWLTAQANRSLQLLSGNRGYTSYESAGTIALVCQQSVKVLAPDGHLCGTVFFAISPAPCQTGAMAVGRDGTVIQPQPLTCSGTDCTCTHRVWPALFH